MSIVHVGMTIDQMAEKVSELEADNRGLVEDLRVIRNQLAAAESARDTASSLVSHYQRCYTQRTGW